MKYALINGSKAEATKGEKGLCPSCNSEVIARCGEVKVNHWAHIGNRNCDPWWENETEWHRSWKDKFPVEWQEIVHYAENGEKHIADVKTQTGYVLEFQHSFLNPEERGSRNKFYSELVWVVDGNRRKTDKKQFKKVIEESDALNKESTILRVCFPEECRLIKEWQDKNALVFFDFQETTESNQSRLWFLFPEITTSEAYLSYLSKQKFIELHNENKFEELVRNNILPIHNKLLEETQSCHKISSNYGNPNNLSGFDRFESNRQIRQRSFNRL